MRSIWFVVAGVLAIAACDDGKAERERELERARERKRAADEARKNPQPTPPAPPTPAPDPWKEPGAIEPYDPNDRELAERLLRGRVHLQRLSEEMRKSGLSSSFEVGDDPRDVYHVGGVCSQAILDDLATRMRSSFSSFGFRRMRCLNFTAPL